MGHWATPIPVASGTCTARPHVIMSDGGRSRHVSLYHTVADSLYKGRGISRGGYSCCHRLLSRCLDNTNAARPSALRALRGWE